MTHTLSSQSLKRIFRFAQHSLFGPSENSSCLLQPVYQSSTIQRSSFMIRFTQRYFSVMEPFGGPTIAERSYRNICWPRMAKSLLDFLQSRMATCTLDMRRCDTWDTCTPHVFPFRVYAAKSLFDLFISLLPSTESYAYQFCR